MPVLSSSATESLLSSFASRDAVAGLAQNITTTGPQPLQVVCAWPVSGQYGPGSRFVYYVLVAACVLARKTEWLRKACLAAALLLPAIAALHGIVLAALHRDGAVDMDVYGAFQLCSIGILAAPVTARLSATYFFDPARNIIFLWTGLILSGLLSLTVEFYRSNTSDCVQDGHGNPVSPRAKAFPYGDDITCGLICSVEDGPFSPMRRGSANNIYVIPAPDKFSFGTATLVAAACCVPAILSMVTMWNKILKISWKIRFADGEKARRAQELIPGTNGATVGRMEGVNSMISRFLSVVEALVFSGAVLMILIIGERNFWSKQIGYQTEPVASVGQWGPLVGTGMAALGSLLLLRSPSGSDAPVKTCDCNRSDHRLMGSSQSPEAPEAVHISRSRSRSPISLAHTSTYRSLPQRWNAGNRGTVREGLLKVSKYIGTAAPDRFDDSEFKHGRASAWPEIPAEEQRNDALLDTRKRYNHSRASSVVSNRTAEGSATPNAHATPPSSDSPNPLQRISFATGRPHSAIFPDKRSAPEHHRSFSTPSGTSAPLARRATLKVPPLIFHHPTRNNLSGTSRPSVDSIPGAQSPPAIVVSPDPEPASPVQSPSSTSQQP